MTCPRHDHRSPGATQEQSWEAQDTGGGEPLQHWPGDPVRVYEGAYPGASSLPKKAWCHRATTDHCPLLPRLEITVCTVLPNRRLPSVSLELRQRPPHDAYSLPSPGSVHRRLVEAEVLGSAWLPGDPHPEGLGVSQASRTSPVTRRRDSLLEE